MMAAAAAMLVAPLALPAPPLQSQQGRPALSCRFLSAFRCLLRRSRGRRRPRPTLTRLGTRSGRRPGPTGPTPPRRFGACIGGAATSATPHTAVGAPRDAPGRCCRLEQGRVVGEDRASAYRPKQTCGGSVARYHEFRLFTDRGPDMGVDRSVVQRTAELTELYCENLPHERVGGYVRQHACLSSDGLMNSSTARGGLGHPARPPLQHASLSGARPPGTVLLISFMTRIHA